MIGYFYSETFQRRMEPVVQFIAGQVRVELEVNRGIFVRKRGRIRWL